MSNEKVRNQRNRNVLKHCLYASSDGAFVSTVLVLRQMHGTVLYCISEMEPGLGVMGHRVSNLGPGRVGLRVKALTLLFDPDSCSML